MLRTALLLTGLLASAIAAAEAVPTPISIPTVAGLSITTAISEPAGDYESVKRLQVLEGKVWRIGYGASLPDGAGRSEELSGERLQHLADLDQATQYRTVFEADVEEDYPGTTALGVSRAVYAALTAGRTQPYQLAADPRQLRPAAPAGDVLALAQAFGSSGLIYRGSLKPTGKTRFRTLVNGVDTELPALVAEGQFKANTGATVHARLLLLDDPQQALALEWQIADSRLRVVRIAWPQPSAALASTLRKQRRLPLPGLYFDFGSARLRPESAAAITQLQELLRAAPELKLALQGHTDDRGAESANLKLSQARAAAVYAALAALDAALAARLTTAGFGESRPVASNESLEGRAANRRVELVVL